MAKKWPSNLLSSIGISESRNVLVLDWIKIEPPFRGWGLGRKALARMIKKYGPGCTLVIMKPFPLQFEGVLGTYDSAEFVAAYRKLIRFYAPLGFSNVGTIRDGEPPIYARESK